MDTPASNLLVCASSAAAATIVAIEYLWYIDDGNDGNDGNDVLRNQRRRASTIRTIGAILWPVFLRSVVSPEDHAHLSLAIGVVWSIHALDYAILQYGPSSKPNRPASIRFEHNCLAGMAFGVCSLVGSKTNGRYNHLFVCAVLGCLVVVLPSHDMRDGSVAQQVFDNVQKSALTWCIGLLVAATSLSHRRCSAA